MFYGAAPGAAAPAGIPLRVDPAKVELPSASSAREFVERGAAALPKVVFHTLGRAALVGLGVAFLGTEDARRNLVRNAVAGAVGIEAFVLWWTWRKAHESGV